MTTFTHKHSGACVTYPETHHLHTVLAQDENWVASRAVEEEPDEQQKEATDDGSAPPHSRRSRSAAGAE